jgi:hypothetical protein
LHWKRLYAPVPKVHWYDAKSLYGFRDLIEKAMNRGRKIFVTVKDRLSWAAEKPGITHVLPGRQL